jgi:hypothetical protein
MRCSCEAEARGPLGPVADEEPLYRAAFSPNHLDKKGRLKPSVFPPSHIANKGLSLLRTQKVEDSKLAEFCQALAAMQEGRKWCGGFQFSCSILRNVRDEDGRLICVFDDPTKAENGVPANDAHAIAVSHDGAMSDEDAMEVRATIIENAEQMLLAK